MEIAYKNTLKEKESIIDIIDKLSSATEENQERKYAERFKAVFFKELWHRCLTVCKMQFGKRNDCTQIAGDIFSESIIIAFKEIKRFKLPKGVNDNNEVKKIVMAWLSTIVNNRILKQRGVLKAQKKNLDSYKEFLKLNLHSGPDLQRVVERSYDNKKVREVWNGLCDLSKDIIHLSCEYDCFPHFDYVTREFQKNKKHLPKDVKNDLLNKHQTTSDNYRKVKERAFKSIFSCIINPQLVK